MPLDKLVLIAVCVMTAIGVAFWLALLVLAAFTVEFASLALIPATFAGYVAYRVIAERVGNKAEDHYDEMDH